MWNLVFLALLLEELGHEVVNLGVCVPAEMLVEQCLRHRPDLVALGTVNGHGRQDGVHAVRRLRSVPALADMPAVIGGKLGIAGDEGGAGALPLLAAGFDAVFEGDRAVAEFRAFLDVLSTVPTAAAVATG
jgi:methylaspartate mutase sigma subunit